jgi:hypothetical protein
VNPTQFGMLYAYPVDGQVYAQPLYVHSLNMPGKGTLNVLYVATMHNSVYAFDADAANGTAPLWQSEPGEHGRSGLLRHTGRGPVYRHPERDRDPQHAGNRHGRATPSMSSMRRWRAAATAFFLHALDLSTGSEKLNGPVQIQATVAGTGWGGTGDAVDGELPLLPGVAPSKARIAARQRLDLRRIRIAWRLPSLARLDRRLQRHGPAAANGRFQYHAIGGRLRDLAKWPGSGGRPERKRLLLDRQWQL